MYSLEIFRCLINDRTGLQTFFILINSPKCSNSLSLLFSFSSIFFIHRFSTKRKLNVGKSINIQQGSLKTFRWKVVVLVRKRFACCYHNLNFQRDYASFSRFLLIFPSNMMIITVKWIIRLCKILIQIMFNFFRALILIYDHRELIQQFQISDETVSEREM